MIMDDNNNDDDNDDDDYKIKQIIVLKWLMKQNYLKSK